MNFKKMQTMIYQTMIFQTMIYGPYQNHMVYIKLKTDQKASLSTIDPNLSLSSNPSFEHNDGKLKTKYFNSQADCNLGILPVNWEAFAS